MRLIENEAYLNTLKGVISHFPYWDSLDGKSIVVSGAAGMIGSLLIDAVMLRNDGLDSSKRCRVIALGRNEDALKERFSVWTEKKEIQFYRCDLSKPECDVPSGEDYYIHGASTTHPVEYSTQPINTVFSNIMGVRCMLEAAGRNRFLLLSSVEVYGENRGDTEMFDEGYCGYIDCNTLRAGYPESKRASESICQAYIEEKGSNAVIVRLPRTYGPTMRQSDSKAIAQFIKKSVAGEDIVLKSEGNQLYSYLYVADSVLALLWVLSKGKIGQAYNAGDPGSDITLRDLAQLLANQADTKVIFDIPDETEKKGYSTATKALMNAEKLRSLGWKAYYNIESGMKETLKILRQL